MWTRIFGVQVERNSLNMIRVDFSKAITEMRTDFTEPLECYI